MPSTIYTFVYYKVRSPWPDDTSVQSVIVRMIPCTYINVVRSSSGDIVLADLLDIKDKSRKSRRGDKHRNERREAEK